MLRPGPPPGRPPPTAAGSRRRGQGGPAPRDPRSRSWCLALLLLVVGHRRLEQEVLPGVLAEQLGGATVVGDRGTSVRGSPGHRARAVIVRGDRSAVVGRDPTRGRL